MMSFFLPQAGGWKSNVLSAVVLPGSVCYMNKNGAPPLIGPGDLAVATLATPIPFAVLQEYPRVHLGPAKADWDSGKLRDVASNFQPGAFIVGFGGTVNFDSSAGGGTRRFGQIYPELLKDPCPSKLGYQVGLGSLVGHCNDYFEWEAFTNAAVGAVAAPGDSGGPLYVTDSSDDSLVLAGVFSGYYDYDQPTAGGKANPPWPRNVWAPTGDTGDVGSHTFLIAALGGDSEPDGVPDAIDNCPGKYNPDQLDEDGDNIGDACDNCPPSYCVVLVPSPFITCKNPSQQDFDKDGVGDTCDLCPEKKNSGLLAADSDGDQVGDDCDTCPLANAYASCAQNTQCAAANAGFCVLDSAAGGSLLFGRCSRVDDGDGDGIPDTCDACPSFPNTSTKNTNDLAEEREQTLNSSIASLADDCDPVPIVRVPAQKPTVMDVVGHNNLNTSSGDGPDEVVDIPQERWLGRQTPSEAPGSALQEAWGYRACSCFTASGFPLPLRDCVKQNSQCSYLAPMTKPLSWRIPKVTLTNGTPILDGNGVTLLQGDFYRGMAQSMTLSWRWRDDVKSANVSGKGTCGVAVESCAAHVAIFTTTLGQVASPRDGSASLRDVFQIIDAPAIKTYLTLPYAVLPPGCQSIPCLDWYNPKLYLFDPALHDFSEAFATPVLLARSGASVGAVTQATGTHDVTSAISATVAGLIGATNRMWLTPAEPAHRIRRLPRRGGVQAVSFPRDYSPTASIDVVFGSGAGLFTDRRIGDGDFGAAAVTLGGYGPRARSDVRAVLSGVEEAIYMVGGRTQSGLPSQAIWRYTIADRAWQIVAENSALVPSSRVLAVTYDEPNAKLYVLDLDDEPHPGNKTTARFTSYDLRAGTAEQHATWPYTGSYEQLWLAATEDGDVLLFAAKQKTYKVWRLRPKVLSVKYAGNHTGVGTLLGQPVVGERDPVVAVVNGAGTVEYRTLTPADFVGPQPCSAL
ncbi:MAG: thrombospondin type 3 repeat-containing protein [Myxococcales bacterium]|nr:thrombospondin type 3 repeat-containing protein [Myxococcales bacterium]